MNGEVIGPGGGAAPVPRRPPGPASHGVALGDGEACAGSADPGKGEGPEEACASGMGGAPEVDAPGVDAPDVAGPAVGGRVEIFTGGSH